MPRTKLRAKTLRSRLRAVNTRTVSAGRRMKAGAMGGMRRMGVERGRYLLTLPFMLAVIVICYLLKAPEKTGMSYRPDTASAPRIYEGVVLDARSDPLSAPDYVTLYYLEATWAELEPEEGEYAFDAMAEEIHLDEWRARGAKMIFRLVLDAPGNGKTLDIPEWLYEKTDGEFYTLNGFENYAPDYSDIVLQDAHLRLLNAVDEYFGSDIAYVELGSLGHNGAWSTDTDADTPLMPLTDVTQVYVWQYFLAFDDRVIMSVKPYRETFLAGCGLYLPDMNDVEGSWELLDMYMYGGYDEETAGVLRADDRYGISSPTGGHADAARTSSFSDLIRMARECRLTYLCVKNADAVPPDELERLNETLGASFWIRSAEWPVYVRRDCSLYADIAMHNDGDTVFPAETALYLALIRDGEVVYSEKTEADPSEWMPGDNVLRVRLTVPARFEPGEYSLAAAVTDEEGNAVPLIMKCEKTGIWSVLGSVTVK